MAVRASERVEDQPAPLKALGSLRPLLRWWPYLVWALAACILATVLAIAIIQGRNKTWFGLLAVAAVVILASLSTRARQRTLLVATVASPLLFGAAVPIPMELTLTQALLLFLSGAILLAAAWSPPARSVFVLGAPYYLPFLLFAGVGMISTFLNGEIFSYWPTVCLLPLLLLFGIERLTPTGDAALSVVVAGLLAVVVYLAIVWTAERTGHSHLLTQYGTDYAQRFANARQIEFGPLSFRVWAIQVGTVAAYGLPACIVLAARQRRWVRRLAFSATGIVCIVILALTAARGATVGAAVGALVAIVISRRFSLAQAIVGVLALTLLLILAGPILLRLFPSQGLARIAAIVQGVQSIGTFRYRLGVWQATFEALRTNPIGHGFQYLWHTRGIDEAIAYALFSIHGILRFDRLSGMVIQRTRLLTSVLKQAKEPSRFWPR